jgi:uncharacterized cofD-like protein
MRFSGTLGKWLIPGIGIKRWILLLFAGVLLASVSLALAFLKLAVLEQTVEQISRVSWFEALVLFAVGLTCIVVALVRLSRSMLAPYRRHQHGRVIDVVYAHSKRQKGLKVAAIGGGTGLPSILRALKPYTSNLTAVVTVADDGGSSGRLRRDLGVLPPGDLRNNIAALADDESLMTRLFQHRFNQGDLGGHAFGNLFISALASVTGSLESALIETERVLNIQGRVFPATMQDVILVAQVRTGSTLQTVRGESRISEAHGQIESIHIQPEDALAYSGSVQALMNADVVVVGPGSLYTSILPNLLVKGIGEALRSTGALKVYVCNIAMQPGETEDYTVADHVLALEKYIGRGIFQVILANNAYPNENAGPNTRYVQPAPEGHEVLQRYEIRYCDLVDTERPWRHDPQKLAAAVLGTGVSEQMMHTQAKPVLA